MCHLCWWPIIGQWPMFVFQTNTNVLEDNVYLLPVNFHQIPFSGCREEVKCVSANLNFITCFFNFKDYSGKNKKLEIQRSEDSVLSWNFKLFDVIYKELSLKFNDLTLSLFSNFIPSNSKINLGNSQIILWISFVDKSGKTKILNSKINLWIF